MKQELKRIPITFNGVDGWEILIKDDEIIWDVTSACDRCIYREWKDDEDLLPICDSFHECTNNYQTYYTFEADSNIK